MVTRDVEYAGDELETIEPEFYEKYTPVGRKSPFVKPLDAIRANEKHHGRWKVLGVYGKRATAASARVRLMKDHTDMRFDLSKGRGEDEGKTLLIVHYKPKGQAG